MPALSLDILGFSLSPLAAIALDINGPAGQLDAILAEGGDG